MLQHEQIKKKITKSLINLKKDIDYTKQPIFFGESLNIQRYDIFKYKEFFAFFEQQLNAFWTPNEIDLSKDRADYDKMSDYEKFIFTSNLKYQILLDSIQSRGIHHLTEDLSNPEIEAFTKAWEFSETLHSYSYTHIIKNVYSNPSDIFDNILNDEEIIKRATSVTHYYDSLINSFGDTKYDKMKKLYLTLVSINILEGIRFYVSFACAYAFAENGKMEGNAKIIKLINRDENLHLGFTQRLLMILRTKEEEGFLDIVKDSEDIVINMYKDAAQEEMKWADYLFKDGSLLGLNGEYLKGFMKHITNERMKVIKLDRIFFDESGKPLPNPIRWVNSYISSDDNQPAPQETEITQYNVGSTKGDLDEGDFDEYEF